MSPFVYEGSQLEVFDLAVNWKNYLRRQLRPYLKGAVLEVGAGMGSATREFCDGSQGRWVCLEPDASLAQRIPGNSTPAMAKCEIRVGSLADLPPQELFDAILYIDVLEHIEDDRAEVALAASHLRSGGVVAIMSPAHQWLFTPFDQSVGHFRRYNKAMLRAIAPQGCAEARMVYLDSVGMSASLANRLLLQSAKAKASQVLFWDRCLIPLSRIADPLLGFTVGKSVLAVWRRTATP